MRWWMALVVLCVLAGCTGGSEPAPAPEPSVTKKPATSAPAPTAPPPAAAPTGEPAPEALSEFRCEPAKKDRWKASGLLANAGKKVASYQVSVYVGPIDGTSRKIRTQQVSGVAPDGSVRFKIDEIPAGGDQCHVQVLRVN